MSSPIDSHLNTQGGNIRALLGRLAFHPLTPEEEEQNARRTAANRAEEERVREANKDLPKDAEKQKPNLQPLIEPHQPWLDPSKLAVIIEQMQEMVLPCLEGNPADFDNIGRLFFWASHHYQGGPQKETRDAFMELGIRQAGDFGPWLARLKEAADNLVGQDAAAEPIVAELIARLHPLSCGKLSK